MAEIMKKWGDFFNGRYSDLFLFLFLFLILIFIYGIDRKISQRPQSIHIWRQTDCLSIAQNYYQRDNPIWEPEIYNMMGDNDTSGKSAGEFPGLYYFIALLWKITGKSELIYRLVTLVLSFLGLFFLFRMNNALLMNRFQAMFISIMLYTSVIFVSYSFSFLPNLPSLSFVFTGWYLFWKFTVTNRDRWLWWAMFSFTLGMLLKVSSGVSYVALGGWLVIELMLPPMKRSLFLRPYLQMIPFFLPLVAVSGWYLYAGWYNHLHNAYYTFNDLWPIWKMEDDYFPEVVQAFRLLWAKEFFPVSTWLVTIAMWIFLLSTLKKRNTFFNYLTIIIPVGTILYLLFWFKALNSHDYYYIELFVFFVMVWVLFFKTMNNYKWFRHWIIYLLLTGWFIFNVTYFSGRFKDRFQSWMNQWYVENLQAVGEIEPLLRAHGVQPDDLVISIPDGSINSTLYLMNQRGFTNYQRNLNTPNGFGKYLSLGAKYLVINNLEQIDQDTAWLKKYMAYPVFSYKNVLVFDLRSKEMPDDAQD
jgi:hypothetical protein